MPLHVNLYHEIQRQEMARRRDPFRLTMLGLLIISTIFVLNYFVALERSHSIGIRYSELEGQWSKIEPKAKDAKARQDDLNTQIAASDAMIKMVDSRFYWAPVMDEILKTVPRTVQITHIGAAGPADAASIWSDLAISGIASSTEPRKQAEAVRTALAAKLGAKFKNVTSVFKNLDDSDEYVMLNGHRLATVTFTMDFQIQVRDPVVVAAPAAAAHKVRSEAAE